MPQSVDSQDLARHEEDFPKSGETKTEEVRRSEDKRMLGDEDDKGRRCEKKAAKSGNGDRSWQGRDERIGAGITEKEERAIESAALWYGTRGVKGR